LLPMAFVTGLMSPYMRPIPINASAGMLLSLAVALIVTPWLCARLLSRHVGEPVVAGSGEGTQAQSPQGFLHRLFSRLLGPFLVGARATRRRSLLLAGTLALVLLSESLAV